MPIYPRLPSRIQRSHSSSSNTTSSDKTMASTSKEPSLSSHQIPLLVTINNTSRHEVLFVNLGISLPVLKSRIVKAVSASPNAEEFMAKYKKKKEIAEESAEGKGKEGGVGEAAARVRVRWSDVGRDMKIWPKLTELTDENLGAVLVILQQSGVGKDVLEVEVDESGDAASKEEEKAGRDE